MENRSIRWQADEYIHQEKSSDWFWAVGIIAVAVAATAIILNNILFAVLILVGTFALCLHAVKKPSQLNYEINETGFVVEKVQYPYSVIESFWVEENLGPARLILRSNKMFVPLIVFPIEEVDPKTIREYLAGKLTEKELHEPLLQKVMEYLGF